VIDDEDEDKKEKKSKGKTLMIYIFALAVWGGVVGVNSFGRGCSKNNGTYIGGVFSHNRMADNAV